MTPAELLTWIFAYTPALQFFVLYFWFYRYEPSRLFHPSREEKGLKAWVAVLTQLRLIKEKVEVRVENSVLRCVMELFLPAAVLSMLSSRLFLPLLMALSPSLTRFGFPLLVLLQFIPASYFLAFLRRNYFGPIPIHRHRTTLPLPRLSSMVRCLGEKEREGR